MTIKQLVWRIGVPLLVIAACAPAAPTPTVPLGAGPPTEPATIGTLETATDRPATEIPATVIPATDVPPTEMAATDVPTTEAAAAIPGLPSAPASPDEYRSDPETLVSATGRPQLLEFFTFW